MDTSVTLTDFIREQYEEYLQDIELANKSLSEAMLNVPDADLICDIYAIPSGNHQAFYAKIYCMDSKFQIAYAKSIINHPVYYSEEIYMYRFTDAVKVNTKDGRQMGKIVCGTMCLEEYFISNLCDKLKAMPDKYIFEEDIFVLDGVMHAIRVYDGGCIQKEAFYHSAQHLPYIEGDVAELQWFYSSLYLMIEQIIGCGAKGEIIGCDCERYASGEYLEGFDDYLNFYEENTEGTRYKCAYCNSFWRSDTNSPDVRMQYRKYKESEE